MAGIIAFGGGRVPPGTVAELRRALSRNPGDTPTEYQSPAAYVAKLDIGTWGAPAFSVGAGGTLAALVGEPLLGSGDGDRAADLSRLHAAWYRDDWSDLQRARGTYCAVYWDEPRRRLTLVADKLGARPLYYWMGDGTMVFATALRILEALPGIPKTMDLRGVTEQITFGAPLGPRTPYAGISTLQSGEMLAVRDGMLKTERYWRWDRVASGAPDPPAPRQLYDLFADAVRLRLRGDRSTLAFLSGGLDSRCVVGLLRSLGAEVTTFNFHELSGTQDQELAAMAAGALQTRHHAMKYLRPGMRPTEMIREVLARPGTPLGTESGRPGVVWSGDGGSVGTGLVYVDVDIVAAARAGRWREVVDLFLSRHGGRPVARLLQRGVVDQVERIPYEGVEDELARLEDAEPGRRFQLFLMANDQRRHLAYFYEDSDLHRLELQIPFFDAEFLAGVLSGPLDDSLGHRLYHRWLGEFAAAARSVPWQTYPRHEPCPLPMPASLSSQWDAATYRRVWQAARPARLSTLRDVRRSPTFPAPILRRWVLTLYELMYRLGVSDYGYIGNTVGTYHRYWAACGGRYTLSPIGSRRG